MKFFNFSKGRRRGSILPLFAGAVVALLMATALAVDYSVLLADKNQLQRVCDASALAGAAYLKAEQNEDINKVNATNRALLVAGLNNLTPTEVAAARVSFPDSPTNTQLKFEAYRTRSLFFARVMGMTEGKIYASATAVVKPFVPSRVPIAITPTARENYKDDKQPHVFTLVVPRETAFSSNLAGLNPFNPFTVFDLSDSQGKSSTQMERQLAGDLETPVNPQIGEQLTGMSLNVGTLARRFEDGIAPRFAKAAQSPWLDPATGVLPASSAWQMVGTRVSDVLNGDSPGNPRIVSFVVVEELPRPESNHNFTIQGFAPAYLHSVQEVGGILTITATLIPPGAVRGSVSLIE